MTKAMEDDSPWTTVPMWNSKSNPMMDSTAANLQLPPPLEAGTVDHAANITISPAPPIDVPSTSMSKPASSLKMTTITSSHKYPKN